MFSYLLFFAINFKLSKFKSIPYYESIVSVLVSSLFFYSISMSTVLNIDRSKSFYVINLLHNSQPISESDLKTKISQKFGDKEYNSYQSRILEQAKRGIVTKENNKYVLSFIGNLIWQISNFLAKIFNLSGWNNSHLL